MKNRQKLIDIIYNDVFCNLDEEFKTGIKNKLVTEDRYTNDEFVKLSNGLIDFKYIPDAELLWFAQFLNEYDKTKEEYNVEQYFTQKEIRDYRFYVKEGNNTDNEQLLTLNDAYSIGKNQYQCRATVEQIALLESRGLVRAEPALQRNSIQKKYGDVVLIKVYINIKRVKAIAKLIEDDTYSYNSIRICTLNDGTGSFEYDEKNRKIYIDAESDNINLDGNHRVKGATLAYFKNPDKKELFQNRYFNVLYSFFTPNEARRTIEQEWKTEPVKREVKKSMKDINANVILNEILLSNQIESIIKNGVVKSDFEYKSGMGFILYNSLSFFIENIYNTKRYKTDREKNRLIKWLIEFYNEIIYNQIDDYIAFNDIKYKKWSVLPGAWVVYTLLSRDLQSNENWKNKLKEILSSINWDISNNPGKYQNDDLFTSVNLFYEDKIKEKI